MKKLLLLLLLIPSLCFAGQGMGPGPGVKGYAAAYTNYVNDASIDAAYFFENNLNDSTSNGNTLTGTNAAYSTNSVHQGTYSFDDTANNAYATRADANLSNGFVGKNSGGTYSVISVGAWFRLTSAGYTRGLVSKWNETTTYRSWTLICNSSNNPSFGLWDSSNYERWYTATGLTVDTSHDYWFAAVYDGANVYLYYATAGDVSPTAVTPTARSHDFAAINEPIIIGAWSDPGDIMQGYIDEAFVFHRALSSSDITSIYQHGLQGNR